MKRQTTLAMYGIVFAAAMALGMVFVSGFSQSMFVASTTDAKAASQMGIFGHITLTATNPDGKIISYIQTDNLIVNRGENCVAETMFNVTTMGDNACIGKGVTTDRFTFIAIGNGTVSIDVNDTKLAQEVNRTQDIDPDVVSSSGTGDPGDSSALVTLTAEFTAGEAVTIEESGIFDAAGKDAGNMLARKTFNPISLAKDDKLTVEWEITIGS
jgi:hypothetical protein